MRQKPSVATKRHPHVLFTRLSLTSMMIFRRFVLKVFVQCQNAWELGHSYTRRDVIHQSSIDMGGLLVEVIKHLTDAINGGANVLLPAPKMEVRVMFPIILQRFLLPSQNIRYNMNYSHSFCTMLQVAALEDRDTMEDTLKFMALARKCS